MTTDGTTTNTNGLLNKLSGNDRERLGEALRRLLRRLPPKIDCWHFGDSDEPGFEILRVLRHKSGRDFRPLHMQAGRIPFEQESLGRFTSSRKIFDKVGNPTILELCQH